MQIKNTIKTRILSTLFLALFLSSVAFAQDSLVFAALGDMGSGEPQQFNIAHQMKAQWDKTKYDFVLLLGDNIYPDGSPALFKPNFEEPYKDLLAANVKFYAVLGNHDIRNGREAELNYDKFSMGGKPYYSFSKGQNLLEKIIGASALIDFFALDSNDMTRNQVTWLEDKLKSSKARWKIVFMHHPMYSSGKQHGSNMPLRRTLEPLLVQYGVDVVLTGHDHIYERTTPQQGIVHFVVGSGGELRRGDLHKKSSFTAAGNDQVNAFIMVRVKEEEMQVEAIRPDGEVIDKVIIAKAKAGAAAKSAGSSQ